MPPGTRRTGGLVVDESHGSECVCHSSWVGPNRQGRRQQPKVVPVWVEMARRILSQLTPATLESSWMAVRTPPG